MHQLGSHVCMPESNLYVFDSTASRIDHAESGNPSAPSHWPVAMALFTIGFICYGATLVFFAAVFPRLARNTSHCRKLRNRYEAGEIKLEEYEIEESLEKNRISNISTVSNEQLYMIFNTFKQIFYRLIATSDT